ncbi:MAG: hypothetical protein Q9224_006335 [Gallowayella concinna]
MLGSDETSQSSLSEVWPDKEFNLPKVLISVALQEEQRLNLDEWTNWLKSVPALAKWVHIEGVYKSDSILLHLSLPVALWDSLPKDPAISFLAFVRSRNLLHPCHQCLSTEACTVRGEKGHGQRHNLFENPDPSALLPNDDGFSGNHQGSVPAFANGWVPRPGSGTTTPKGFQDREGPSDSLFSNLPDYSRSLSATSSSKTNGFTSLRTSGTSTPSTTDSTNSSDVYPDGYLPTEATRYDEQSNGYVSFPYDSQYDHQHLAPTPPTPP